MVSTLSMPQPTLKPNERQHWSRVQAAVLNRYNWPAKPKTRPEYVVRLASKIADLALAAYRERVQP